jgi:hypothetical protein
VNPVPDPLFIKSGSTTASGIEPRTSGSVARKNVIFSVYELGIILCKSHFQTVK